MAEIRHEHDCSDPLMFPAFKKMILDPGMCVNPHHLVSLPLFDPVFLDLKKSSGFGIYAWNEFRKAHGLRHATNSDWEMDS